MAVDLARDLLSKEVGQLNTPERVEYSTQKRRGKVGIPCVFNGKGAKGRVEEEERFVGNFKNLGEKVSY